MRKIPFCWSINRLFLGVSLSFIIITKQNIYRQATIFGSISVKNPINCNEFDSKRRCPFFNDMNWNVRVTSLCFLLVFTYLTVLHIYCLLLNNVINLIHGVGPETVLARQLTMYNADKWPYLHHSTSQLQGIGHGR